MNSGCQFETVKSISETLPRVELGAAGDARAGRGHPMRPYPMASVGVRRGLPTAGGRGTPFGLLPALASPCRTRRSNPGAPKLTMSQEVVAMFVLGDGYARC